MKATITHATAEAREAECAKPMPKYSYTERRATV